MPYISKWRLAVVMVAAAVPFLYALWRSPIEYWKYGGFAACALGYAVGYLTRGWIWRVEQKGGPSDARDESRDNR